LNKYALYPGCTAPVRAMNYESSTRNVARALGVHLEDINDFGCCGFPVKSVHVETALLLATRNLALAEQRGLDICAMCNSCAGTLAEANHQLQHDDELRARVNTELEKTSGLRYNGTVRVRHIARILYEEVGLERIREAVKVDLSDLQLAAHYGCHYLKPAEAHDFFDDPENPHTLDDLIEATGATSIDYEGRFQCCGGGILGADEQTALALPHLKLERVVEVGADAMILICPFCDIMYEMQQKRIEKIYDSEYKLPVLYYTQLLGMAMGLSEDEIGLKLNRVKSRKIMQIAKGR
jgi:heterodisulfide reductase subunit B